MKENGKGVKGLEGIGLMEVEVWEIGCSGILLLELDKCDLQVKHGLDEKSGDC